MDTSELIRRFAVSYREGIAHRFYPRLVTVEVDAYTPEAAAQSVSNNDLGYGGSFFVTELPAPIHVALRVVT